MHSNNPTAFSLFDLLIPTNQGIVILGQDVNQWVKIDFACDVSISGMLLVMGNIKVDGFEIDTLTTIHVETSETSLPCSTIDEAFNPFSVKDIVCETLLTGNAIAIDNHQVEIAEIVVFHDEHYGIPESTTISASSTQYKISNAIDGFIARDQASGFLTLLELHPWFQMEFPTSVSVIRVIFIQRLDYGGHLFRDIQVFVGDSSTRYGKLASNQLCNKYFGPSQDGQIDIVDCSPPRQGKFLVVQKVDFWNLRRLIFGEIIAHLGPSVTHGE